MYNPYGSSNVHHAYGVYDCVQHRCTCLLMAIDHSEIEGAPATSLLVNVIIWWRIHQIDHLVNPPPRCKMIVGPHHHNA